MKISLDSGYPVPSNTQVSKESSLTHFFQPFNANYKTHLNQRNLCSISREDPRISAIRSIYL
jgi:hypothetical protein